MCRIDDLIDTCEFLNAERAVLQSEVSRLTLELEASNRKLAESEKKADILAIPTKQHHSSGDKDEIKQSIIQEHDKNDKIQVSFYIQALQQMLCY